MYWCVRILLLPVFLLSFVAISVTTQAATYYVNDTAGNEAWDGLAAAWDGAHGPKATIQAGLDAAADNDTVLVADGTYTGAGNRDLDFHGKAITLRSENGPETTIIDCQGAKTEPHRGFTFHSGETAAAVVDGFTIRGGNISSHLGGAGIFCGGSSPTIVNCTITENVSYDGGGIFCCEGSSMTIRTCSITKNKAANGGGIGIHGESNPTISVCIIEANIADASSFSDGGKGGGIWCDRSSMPLIKGSVIRQNVATGSDEFRKSYGGGVYCEGARPVISGCVIAENMAAGYGGGIHVQGPSSLALDNCIIQANRAAYGGGLSCMGGAVSPINCTIIRNAASAGQGSGIYMYEGAMRLTNCIVWDEGKQIIRVGDGQVALTYCDVRGGWPGEGNFNLDPMLTRDGHLQGDSPCIGAGTATGASLVDIDGEPRPYPVGDGCDVGADEFIDTDRDGLPDYWEAAYYERASGDPDRDGLSNRGEYENATDPDNPDADADGRGDGDEVADGTSPHHVDNAAKTYFVNWATGDDSWNGLSPVWEAGVHGPKATIQAGIDATVDGWDYTVLVANGTYTGAGNKDLDLRGREITLQSEHGPESTIIDCEDSGRGFYFRFLETANTVVSGFTICNGSVSANGGGVYVRWTSSPTIIDCVIRDNRAVEGGGLFLGGKSPRITNCIVTGNSASARGGGLCCQGTEFTSSDAIITHCVVRNNLAGWGGGGIYSVTVHYKRSNDVIVTGSTISGNMAGERGGGIGVNSGFLTITECTIEDNSATEDGGGVSCEGALTMCQSVVAGNSSQRYGGGVNCYWEIIRDCTIANNTARYCGGGIACSYGKGEITGCTIANNTADCGGGIWAEWQYAQLSVSTCIIVRNTARRLGGGAYCEGFDSKTTFTNCTFAANVAKTKGGSIAARSSDLRLTNSILWGNSPQALYHDASSRLEVKYCDVEGGWPGNGNLDADPLFVDAAAGDYRIVLGSPCVDAGTSDGAPALDIEGFPRWDERTVPNTGGGEFPYYDIGAYEFYRGKRYGQRSPHPGKGRH